MNPEVKTLWLEALRSGEYKQGQNQLCVGQPGDDDAQFCCLGVLTDLAVKAGVATWNENDLYSTSKVPSSLVLKWAGLSDPSVPTRERTTTDHPATLIYLNDAERRGFSGIADVIERDL